MIAVKMGFEHVVGGELPLAPGKARLWINGKSKIEAIRKVLKRFAGSSDSGLWLGFGRSALGIALDICDVGVNTSIALSSYQCVAVAKKIASRTKKWNFYGIDEKLIPIKDSFLKVARQSKVVFTTIYFGAREIEMALQSYVPLLGMGETRPWIIEDRVMCFPKPNDPIQDAARCDFSIYSFRKHFPIPDGALLIACSDRAKEALKKFLSIHNFSEPTANRLVALTQKVEAKSKRASWLSSALHPDNGKRSGYLESVRSEKILDKLMDRPSSDYVWGSSSSALLLTKLYKRQLKTSLSRQLALIIGAFSDINRQKYELPVKQVVGLGVPLLLDNRDTIRDELRKQGVFLPVHWPSHNVFPVSAHDEHWRQREITLPTLSHLSRNDTSYMISKIKKVLC